MNSDEQSRSDELQESSTMAVPPEKESKPQSKKGLSLSQMILIGLFAGIGCGLFFGEWCANLQIIGDVFIGLLQMVVLPAIVLSLISGIGRLTVEQSQKLASKAILVLLMLWGIGFVTVLLIPLAFPIQESGSFFSTSLVEASQPIDLFGLFIPKNPFNSLADNEVPAVVVFCLFVGISMITIPKKKRLLELIDMLSDSMSKVMKMVVKLTPIGVFAIAASAAGTMTLGDLGRLQGYLITYTLATVILGIVILPATIAAMTNFRYRDIVAITWDTLILTFAVGKVLVVLPIIVENIKSLFKQYELENEEVDAMAEVIVPLGFPFPHLGRLVVMGFIPFSAWFVGSPLTLIQLLVLLPVGFLVMFGSSAVAIPFLLDMMKLPADLFQVFVLTDVLVDRLSNVLAAMHLFTFGVLTTAALFGMLHIRKKRLRNLLVSSLLLAAIAIGGTRIYLSSTSGAYDKDEILANMRLLEKSVPTVILEAEPNPVPLRPSQSTLSRIAERGIIRVGYIPDNLPFSYLNSKGELVGFDIDMAQRFAEALEVKIEFVPFSLDELSDALKEDYFDIAMSGIFGNIERVVKDVFFASEDYLNVTMAIVVPDYRDQEFATVDSMRKIKPLKVAVIDEYFAEKIEQYSNVSHEVVVLESPRDFFEQKEIAKDVDALIISAEAGAAWTLLYPDFQVANPSPRKISVPLVYVFRDDLQMNKTMDQWIGNKELDGTIAQVYDYWILGKGSEQKEPRWSIIRNVLGWVD